MPDLNIAVIIGSLRAGSHSRALARALTPLAPAGMTLDIVEIGGLPLYNPDLDGPDAPAGWTAFRDAMRRHDAVLFVTPEYNRSVPGALKNAIDVGSRPYGASVWSGRPAAVISVSPGNLSAFGANHHLRQSLVFLDMPTLQQPEAYIAHVDKRLGPDGALDADSAVFLGGFLAKFADFAARNRV